MGTEDRHGFRHCDGVPGILMGTGAGNVLSAAAGVDVAGGVDVAAGRWRDTSAVQTQWWDGVRPRASRSSTVK